MKKNEIERENSEEKQIIDTDEYTSANDFQDILSTEDCILSVFDDFEP